MAYGYGHCVAVPAQPSTNPDHLCSHHPDIGKYVEAWRQWKRERDRPPEVKPGTDEEAAEWLKAHLGSIGQWWESEIVRHAAPRFTREQITYAMCLGFTESELAERMEGDYWVQDRLVRLRKS